jgi:hypothetical protein
MEGVRGQARSYNGLGRLRDARPLRPSERLPEGLWTRVSTRGTGSERPARKGRAGWVPLVPSGRVPMRPLRKPQQTADGQRPARYEPAPYRRRTANGRRGTSPRPIDGGRPAGCQVVAVIDSLSGTDYSHLLPIPSPSLLDERACPVYTYCKLSPVKDCDGEQ